MPECYLINHFERRAYPLRQPLFTIGRDSDSDLVLREPTVSRTHARLVLDGDDAILETLGPTGTRINGENVVIPRKLEQGDQILIGTAKLTFASGALPTGFALATGGEHPESDPDTRRTTIRTPLLHAREKKDGRRFPLRASLLLVVAVLAMIFAIFARG
jgi:pSer/pThr/pTyr-binding forkhead associated (FHA) protein